MERRRYPITKLPDHPQSQAEYQHLQQTCDVISLETRKLEAETVRKQ